jgi:hypothetical protein
MMRRKTQSRLDKPQPIVPLHMTKGVKEITDYKGKVLIKVDETEIEAAIQELVRKGAEAIGGFDVQRLSIPSSRSVAWPRELQIKGLSHPGG